MRLQDLRKKYPKFVYEKYSYRISKNNLEILFGFKIEPDISFTPRIIIENVSPAMIKKVGERVLDNLIFNVGLMEIPSYWKTTCSPVIEIKTGYFNAEQTRWWKDLFLKGMGQFYYENKINFKKPDFLKFKVVVGNNIGSPEFFLLKNRYLVPFAGGRDSIVTLEGLKKAKKEIALFTVNPIEKIQRTVKVSGIKKQIIVKRVIDPELLKMNKRGYLNGHTPFTSLLSFLSVLCAVIFDYRNIAFSNEKSADEGNVKYLGETVNHQWAKSSEFERKFRFYSKKYLAGNLNYFSYLRKHTELQISRMLTKYPKYFPVFSSCNAGMRIDKRGVLNAKERWCGNCPKCLFVYLSLYPFLKKKDLIGIFSKDVFENKKLLPVMKDLLSEKRIKPFECVGTKKESREAFRLSKAKAKKEGKIPYLLSL